MERYYSEDRSCEHRDLHVEVQMPEDRLQDLRIHRVGETVTCEEYSPDCCKHQHDIDERIRPTRLDPLENLYQEIVRVETNRSTQLKRPQIAHQGLEFVFGCFSVHAKVRNSMLINISISHIEPELDDPSQFSQIRMGTVLSREAPRDR